MSDYYIIAKRYPVEAPAALAYSRAYAEVMNGDDPGSCWRLTTPDREAWYVIAIVLDRPLARRLNRVMRVGGEDWTPPRQTISDLVDRRLRTAIEGAKAGRRETRQRAHYPQGMVLRAGGRMEPYRRPQG